MKNLRLMNESEYQQASASEMEKYLRFGWYYNFRDEYTKVMKTWQWWLSGDCPPRAVYKDRINYMPDQSTGYAYVRPVLDDPTGSLKVGQVYIFGKDLYNLPLRWVAITSNTLLLYELPCWTQAETVVRCSADTFLGQEFAAEQFTAKESKSIINGTIAQNLVPFNGVITVPRETSLIPEYRYVYDTTITTIIIESREGTKPLQIDKGAFKYSTVKKIEGLENCGVIENEAFSSCNITGELKFENVTINNDAFSYNLIEAVQFNGMVNKIGTAAFGTNEINNITFGENGYIIELLNAFSENHVPIEIQKLVFDRVLLQYDEKCFF